MRIQTNKTKLWRLARDYGAQPPPLKYTRRICYGGGSYGLTWPGGPKVYLTAVLGRPVLLSLRDGGGKRGEAHNKAVVAGVGCDGEAGGACLVRVGVHGLVHPDASGLLG